jgi:hypothetical protein
MIQDNVLPVNVRGVIWSAVGVNLSSEFLNQSIDMDPRRVKETNAVMLPISKRLRTQQQR